jgi:hypothetical protein
MASAKLGLMHSLPGLFNQPAATQGGFAQNYLQAAQGAPMQQTSQQPLAPQIAQGVGGLISGASQGYNAAAQQGQQQDTLNSLLKALQGQQTGGLSYTPMAEGGIVTQPTRALIGEAGPEAVIPLRQLTGAQMTDPERQRMAGQQGLPPALLMSLIQALRGGGRPSTPVGNMGDMRGMMGGRMPLNDPTLRGPVTSGALTGRAGTPNQNSMQDLMNDPRFKLGTR